MDSSVVLPIALKPSNLRPLAYRVLSKKHGLNIQSSALEILSEYIGSKFGNEWRGPKTINFLENIARIWKDQDKGLFVDGDSVALIIREISIQDEQERKRHAAKTVSTAATVTRSDTIVDTQGDSATPGPEFDIYESQRNTQTDEDDTDSLKWKDFFKVIDISNYKRFKYNSKRRQFDYIKPTTLEKESGSLVELPSTQDTINYFISRLHILKDRLLRNENFQPTTFSAVNSITGSINASGGTGTPQSTQITAIKNLLGRHGQRFALFGLLTKNSKGLWQLQDDSDAIELELTQAIFPDTCFFVPGNFVICDGIYSSSGKFYVSILTHPPPERREQSLEALGSMDFTSTYSKNGRIDPQLKKKLLNLEEKYTDHKIVVLGGDLFLNDLKVLEALKKLFGKISKDLESTSSTVVSIIFNGPFAELPFDATEGSSSSHLTSSGIYKSYFDSLATILENYPIVCKSSKFIFVPGDKDPWSSMVTKDSNSFFPKLRIPRVFGNRLTRLIDDIEWVSNPCRINYLAQEILIVRDNLNERFTRNDISYLSTVNEDDMDEDEGQDDDGLEIDKITRNLQQQKLTPEVKQARKVVKSLLDQGNISPFTSQIRPVYSNYAHALSLVPLPNVLLLVDPTSITFDLIYENCHVLNPGKFLKQGRISYLEYYPATRKAQQMELY